MQGKNSAEFRSLLRRTGNTTNVGIFVTGLCGYMLVDRIWSWQAAIGAALFSLAIGPIIAFSISAIMRKLRSEIETVIDAPDLESVDPKTLELGRRYLLDIPATNFVVSSVVWLVILPAPIYFLLSGTGLDKGSLLQLYISIGLVFPILAYMSAVQFEYALRPYVKLFFPQGGVEKFRSKYVLSVRSRVLGSFALIGPYFTIVIAILLFRRVHESETIEVALSRLIPLELFLVCLSVCLFFVIGRYLDRIVNIPLKKLLDTPGSADGEVADALSVESADDWGIVVDRINERKRAQDELTASEARIRSVIESMPVGLLLLTEKGVIELSNSALQRDTGYSADELRDKHFSLILNAGESCTVPEFWLKIKGEKADPAKTTCVRKSYDNELESKSQSEDQSKSQSEDQSKSQSEDQSKSQSEDQSKSQSEDQSKSRSENQSEVLCENQNESQRKDQSEYPVELTIQEFESREGKRYLAILTDITEREEMEKVKQQFVAVVSHELRSPLTSMLAYLSMLTEGVYGDLNQQGLKRTDATRRNITRLMDLVKDILDIERLESGQISYLTSDVSLASVIKRSVEGIEEFAERQRVTLKASTSDLVVHADEDRLIQVVINLLSNAIKFSREGNVEISITEEDSFVKIGVRDDGRGIPAESQEIIFERFKQVSGADQHTGTGLGLPICKSIVEHHGGKIGVESAPGKGSFFWFTLPKKL